MRFYRQHQRVCGGIRGLLRASYYRVRAQGIRCPGQAGPGDCLRARIMLIRGNFDDALSLVREVTRKHPIVLVNSLNPYRIQGQKTASFEIIEDLGTAPDYLFIPVGNAGNITAYWLGFKEAAQMGWTTARPKMMGFQAEGAAPIVRGAPVEKPETIASAIRVGNPAVGTTRYGPETSQTA